ncbi:MAG: hypothetical protein LBL79_12520 [Prevotella sp.]|jgi:chromosomal replication initiation ATPase DnaA|nr:hypothetical protein [Prevotella sp.]
MITIERYSSKTGVSTDFLLGKSRRFHISLAREMYWLYLRKNGFTYHEIAEMFGRRQHSTVSSGINTAKNMLLTKEEWALFCIEALNMRGDEFF